MKNKVVFLTGATGLVGSYLLKMLIKANYKIYVLARRKGEKSPVDRVKNILSFWDKDLFFDQEKVIVLDGDLTKVNFGIDKKYFDKLKEELNEIIHCAALTSYKYQLKDFRTVNVLGTKKILDFALQCKKLGEFKKVNHISTAYICGNFTGPFEESDLDVGQKFNSSYEQSKFEAEKLIQEYRDEMGLWIDIFRPCAVVGDSKDGKITSFQFNFYRALHFWSLEIFDYFPGKGLFINLVPVDELAESIIMIDQKNSTKNMNFHTFCKDKIDLEQITDAFCKLTNYKRPIVVTSEEFYAKSSCTSGQKKLADSIFLPFNGRVQIVSSKTGNLLQDWGFNYSKINEESGRGPLPGGNSNAVD